MMTQPQVRKPTVIVHLMGGLGNQMFQYAFGRRLSLHNSADLRIDTSAYPAESAKQAADGFRAVGLSHFRVEGRLTNDPYDESKARVPARRWVRKAMAAATWIGDWRKPYFLRHRIVEPDNRRFRFDARLLELELRGTISVRGFWQSEAYFLDAEEQIRRELVVRNPPDAENAAMARRIQNSRNAVAIHVRHGDNANGVAPELGVLPRAYYIRAISEMRREVAAENFFVFSDDIAWSRQLLPADVPMVFVNHNGSMDCHEDLRLMTLCRHHILANSTFGWWGAWLANRPGQIVIAPRRYYQGVDRPNPDLYPPRWRLL